MNTRQTDSIRRQEFTTYFEKTLKGERAPLIDSGISKGRITQYLDPGEPFGEKAAANIEDRLGLKRGTIFPSLIAARHPATTTVSQSVPIVGRAKLGDQDCYFAELEYPVGIGEGAIEWPTKDPNAYALRCVGDSMKPRIKHGEFVIVEPNHKVHPGDEVVIKDKHDRVMVKQFVYENAGRDYFASVNEAYAPFSLEPADILFIHYIAGIAKSALHREA